MGSSELDFRGCKILFGEHPEEAEAGEVPCSTLEHGIIGGRHDLNVDGGLTCQVVWRGCCEFPWVTEHCFLGRVTATGREACCFYHCTVSNTALSSTVTAVCTTMWNKHQNKI